MATPFPVSEEHAYFLEIEILFNSLRRSAALLSPVDWQVAHRWWECGVPVTLVQSALENVFRLRRERGVSDRIQSLSYCESAVENAFQHLKELGYGEHPQPTKVSISERLVAMIKRLEDFGKEHREDILACGKGTEDPAEAERRLAALEIELSKKAQQMMGALEAKKILLDLEQKVALATDPLRLRLDLATLERTRQRTRERLHKELMGIPRLSLFV